jgi:transcription-repair coupling factor (superfamily II helicase)
MTAEKIRVYKELDSTTSDKELDNMKKRLEDRFGPMPDELSRLFDIVRIRQLGEKIGFEKIIIKNGVLIAFFISNPLSQYYRSNRFSKVLESVTLNPNIFELKQNDNRLRILSRNIDTISKAYSVLKKL